MWTHCIVCAADLGSNEEVEEFPVGEKLAFDLDRGRLWVVCPRCGRWNLTPLEARWEAVEACERLWEASTIRAAGERVGLARRKSGLWLVRVGRSSSRNELAVWRWGRKGRTWRRPSTQALVGWGLAVTATAGVGLMAPIVLPMALAVALPPAAVLIAAGNTPSAVPSRDGLGAVSTISKYEFVRAGMNPADDDLGWSIHMQRLVAVEIPPERKWTGHDRRLDWLQYTGDDARAIARRAFPLLNRRHSKAAMITDALDLIVEGGGPEQYLRTAAAQKPHWVPFKHYPEPMRLAAEIVLFEEEERKAMEGELGRLEEAWEEAEELAAISDDLLPPPGWTDFKRRFGPAGDLEGPPGSTR